MKHIITCAFWLAVEQFFKENPGLKSMFYQTNNQSMNRKKTSGPNSDFRYDYEKRRISLSQGTLLLVGKFMPGKEDCLFCFSAKKILENGSQEHISSFFCWAPLSQ